MIKVDPFTLFDRNWALLTSGRPDHFNTMTISWGELGTLWHMPVVTVFVRPARYTYEFMEEGEYFTVSFFDEDHKADLAFLGSHSGRDGDKLARTGLTPQTVGQTVGFEEASMTLVCQKIYWQDLDPAHFPEGVAGRFYPDKDWHRMYIGQVLEVVAG